MKKFNMQETLKNIEKHTDNLEKETSSQPFKPFFTVYAKKRKILNPLKYILGEYKFKYFEKNKQPKKYKNAFDLYADLIDLDVKDISL